MRDQASHWWVRLDGGDLSATERREFERWCEQSPAHRAAFAELCALWGELDALKPRLAAGPDLVGVRGTAEARKFALAAAAVLLAVIAAPLFLSRPDYRTAVGELRTVRLDDGSTVHLGSASALNVRLTTGRRSLELLEGEACFEVARDPLRPFVVKAGQGTATALGTVYDVRHVDGEVRVAVLESRVAVDYSGAGGGIRHLTLSAGQQTGYSEAQAPTPAMAADPETVSAWRRGRLMFENRPLGEVIAELNRYHRGLILIADPKLRERRVNGVFRTDHPAGVISALERSLGIESTRLTDYLIVLHR